MPVKRAGPRAPGAVKAKTQTTAAGGFVPISALRPDARSVDDVLAEIRRIYFRTTARTIEADLHHAVALLKALPDEDTRERATVYMEGLADMRKEFTRAPARGRK